MAGLKRGNCSESGENTERSKGRNGRNGSMEQRVWREGLAVGCDLCEVASRRADGSSHVLMGCLKPRDTKKSVVFRGIITDSKGS